MVAQSRREWILSAATAATAFGLDKKIAVAAPPLPRRQSKDPPAGFVRYKIGDAECTAIYDGIWEKAHDQRFIANATIEDTKHALAAAGLPTAYVPIQITVFVIKLNGKLIMCDSGGGDQIQAFNPKSVFLSGKLMANMKSAGIEPEKIETILISHFHPDHIFGLLEKGTNAPVFPNAEIIVPAAEYKFWTDPSLIDRLPEGRKNVTRRIQAIIPNWKNVLPVEGEDEVVPGISFVKTPGHSPGHTAFHLSSGNEQLMLSGDAAYVPALTLPHPGWHGVYDQDAALAETSRRRLFDRIVADKMLMCGTHFPWPGLGKIEKDGGGYALTVRTA